MKCSDVLRAPIASHWVLRLCPPRVCVSAVCLHVHCVSACVHVRLACWEEESEPGLASVGLARPAAYGPCHGARAWPPEARGQLRLLFLPREPVQASAVLALSLKPQGETRRHHRLQSQRARLCPDPLPERVFLWNQRKTPDGAEGGGWRASPVLGLPIRVCQRPETHSCQIQASARWHRPGGPPGTPRSRGLPGAGRTPPTEGKEGGRKGGLGVAPGAPSLFLLVFQRLRQRLRSQRRRRPQDASRCQGHSGSMLSPLSPRPWENQLVFPVSRVPRGKLLPDTGPNSLGPWTCLLLRLFLHYSGSPPS